MSFWPPSVSRVRLTVFIVMIVLVGFSVFAIQYSAIRPLVFRWLVIAAQILGLSFVWLLLSRAKRAYLNLVCGATVAVSLLGIGVGYYEPEWMLSERQILRIGTARAVASACIDQQNADLSICFHALGYCGSAELTVPSGGDGCDGVAEKIELLILRQRQSVGSAHANGDNSPAVMR